jgi:hypothetical protein
MAPLLKELSILEIETLKIVENAPSREGFDTVRSQERSLDSITVVSDNFEADALLMGTILLSQKPDCCCCLLCCC